MRDKYYKAALKFVNEFRDELGLDGLLELPPGRQGSARCCPIALGVGGCATATVVHTYANGKLKTKYCSDEVSRFIQQFDRGRYPELVLNSQDQRWGES